MNAEWTDVARRYWAEAGVADRIDLRLGPALETLDGLIAEGEAGTFDFAFIDAARQDSETRSIRAFNEKIHADPRVSLSLVPIGDGLTLARKRP